MNKKKKFTDPALRQSFLEQYAARDARKKLTHVTKKVGVRRETLDHWLRDPDFVQRMQEIDRRRLDAALYPATTLWPSIVEEQAGIAAGMPEAPPDVEHLTPRQFQLMRAAYTTRAAKRVTMSTRAAEFVADVLGVRRKPDVSVEVGIGQETFGGLPEDLEGLVKENERLDDILKRAKARLAQQQKEGQQ